MPNTDERELDQADMQRLAAGHDAALNDLMNRHGTKLFHYLIRLLQNEDDAADTAQEVFVRVYQHRARFNPSQKFSSWLYAIATNLVKDRYRHRARHPQVSLEAQNEATGGDFRETLPAPNPSPSESMQAVERIELIRQAVSALPDELRVAFILSEYEDKSQAEVGAILGCSPKAVETRLYRARKFLRSRLERNSISC
jgi:RNA polymerase sigma factor (sigma-70 family)